MTISAPRERDGNIATHSARAYEAVVAIRSRVYISHPPHPSAFRRYIRFHRAYLIIASQVSGDCSRRARSIARPPRRFSSLAGSHPGGHTCTATRRRKTSGPFERNESSLDARARARARGSIHSAWRKKFIQPARTPAAHVSRYLHRSAAHARCLRGIYLHTGFAIGDDTGVERILSFSLSLTLTSSFSLLPPRVISRLREIARRRAARLDVNATEPGVESCRVASQA